MRGWFSQSDGVMWEPPEDGNETLRKDGRNGCVCQREMGEESLL